MTTPTLPVLEPAELQQTIDRWLHAYHAVESLPPASEAELTEPLKHRLEVLRECFERQYDLLARLDQQPVAAWQPLVPSDLHDHLLQEADRFRQLRLVDGAPQAAGPIVMAFSLWNDAPGEARVPATAGEAVVAFWEQVQSEFEVLRARLLREARLIAPSLAGTLDLDLLPPLALELIDSPAGWPPGPLESWSETDIFDRSPPNNGDWLRAGMIVLRVRAPDYATFAWIEHLVLEHWRPLAERLATPRCSIALGPDLEGGRLSAHYLRWELLSRQVDAILEDPELSRDASALLIVDRDAAGVPRCVHLLTRLPPENTEDEDSEDREIAGHCDVRDQEGLAAAVAPWLAIYRPGFVLHIEQQTAAIENTPSASSASGLPSDWFAATPPSRLH